MTRVTAQHTGARPASDAAALPDAQDSRRSAPRASAAVAEIAFLAVLVLVGAALRFYRLDSPLWFDEIVTLIESVRPPLGDIVTSFPGNNHHPLYSVLAHLSISAFGETPWAFRLPAALFGIASIPALYYLGAAVAARREAAAGAMLLTVSYHHIWFSQNARAYTTLLFCATLGTFALIRWLATGRRSFLVVYVLVTAMGAYAHLTMVMVAMAQALALGCDWLIYRRASRIQAQWGALVAAFAAAAILTVLLYAPMLLDVGSFFTTQTAAANEVATPRWAMLAAMQGLQVGFGMVWAILLGGLIALVGAVSYLRTRPTVALLFLLPLPVTVVLAVAAGRPVFPRFGFFAVGFVLLIVLRGTGALAGLLARFANATRLHQRASTYALAIVTIVGVLLSARSLPYGYNHPKQDYAEAVNFLEGNIDVDDRVVLIGDTATIPVAQYLGKPWQRVDDASQLQEVRRDASRVYVLYTFPAYIQSGRPDVWAVLQDECPPIHEVAGTVAGGTITIRRCP